MSDWSAVHTLLRREFLGMALFPENAVSLENRPVVTGNHKQWAGLYFLPVDTVPRELGSLGRDQYIGIMQVDINVRQNEGSGPADDLADRVRTQFWAGRTFTDAAARVTVARTTRSGGAVVDNFWRVSCSVNFYSFLARTT